MKKAIINQMKRELYDTRYCQKDFEYDMQSINDMESFFWCVYKYGTVLCDLSEIRKKKIQDSEAARFLLFRNQDWLISPISSTIDSNEQFKLFYFNGWALKPIDISEMSRIYNQYMFDFMIELAEKHQDEVGICDKKLEIQFSSEHTREMYESCKKWANEHDDKSLDMGIQQLQSFSRIAKDQTIVISSDLYEKSFTWGEYVNGKCKMNGGLLFDSGSEYGHWQIHT